MAGGEGRRENLIALYEHARAFEGAGYKGLFAFVSHLRFLLENGEQPAGASGSTAGGVRIMSIHRSKGLDMPTYSTRISSSRISRLSRSDRASRAMVG